MKSKFSKDISGFFEVMLGVSFFVLAFAWMAMGFGWFLVIMVYQDFGMIAGHTMFVINIGIYGYIIYNRYIIE